VGVLLSGLDSTPDRCTFRPIPQSAWLRIPLYLRRGSLNSPRLLRDSRRAGPGLFRHDGFARHESGLAETLAHVDGSVRLHRRHERVDLPIAGITSNFTEVAVLAQVQQEGWIANAAIEPVLVGGDVPFAEALDHTQQVVLDVELGLFGVAVG
jgi:hypothetical protein